MLPFVTFEIVDHSRAFRVRSSGAPIYYANRALVSAISICDSAGSLGAQLIDSGMVEDTGNFSALRSSLIRVSLEDGKWNISSFDQFSRCSSDYLLSVAKKYCKGIMDKLVPLHRYCDTDLCAFIVDRQQP